VADALAVAGPVNVRSRLSNSRISGARLTRSSSSPPSDDLPPGLDEQGVLVGIQRARLVGQLSMRGKKWRSIKPKGRSAPSSPYGRLRVGDHAPRSTLASSALSAGHGGMVTAIT
jgi:hypothetical protein